jgi:hypothetical protein
MWCRRTALRPQTLRLPSAALAAARRTNSSPSVAATFRSAGTMTPVAPAEDRALRAGTLNDVGSARWALATAGGLLVAGFTASSLITRQRGPEGSAREDRSQTVDGSSMGRMHDEVASASCGRTATPRVELG